MAVRCALGYIQVGGIADDAACAAPSPSRFALGRRSQAHTETDKRNTTKFVVYNSENDIKTRKLLVNTFIRDILWYGDHIVITYNFQEYAATDRFCKSYVEQLEKQVGDASRTASSFPLCSYKFRHSAPVSPQGDRRRCPYLCADILHFFARLKALRRGWLLCVWGGVMKN